MASALSVGMMKLTRGKFSGLDGTWRLWLTAVTNSNQLCTSEFCRCITLNHAQNKITKEMAVPAGMICSIVPEDFPPANSASQ
jgi:hypothetical protein